MDSSVLTPFALGAIIAATLGFGAIAVLFSAVFSRGISSVDKLVVIWCVYDTITHFLLVDIFLY